MKNSLLLAFRYMAYYRVRTVILVVCLSIAAFLPLAVHVLVSYYNRVMIERAQATPLVIGAEGSEYDLVFGTVYFKGRLERRISMQEADDVRREGLAVAIPMYVRFTAGGHAIVGTTLDYFQFRGLQPANGTLPQMLGDVVLGATAARRLGLDVGDKLLSDDEELYDISSTYPLLMRVSGILEETGTADDMVVFADVRTTWIIEGIGHGHVGAQEVTDPMMLRAASGRNMVLSGAVVQHNEITPEALDSFHFHGERKDFPLTAVIVLPRDDKSATILKNRYGLREGVQAVVPRKVVEEMTGIVLRVKRFFDAVFVMVLASTALFLVLVVMLSLRIRQREFQTLHKIGCSRSTVFALQAAEVALLLAVSLTAAAALSGAMMWYVVRFDVLL